MSTYLNLLLMATDDARISCPAIGILGFNGGGDFTLIGVCGVFNFPEDDFTSTLGDGIEYVLWLRFLIDALGSIARGIDGSGNCGVLGGFGHFGEVGLSSFPFSITLCALCECAILEAGRVCIKSAGEGFFGTIGGDKFSNVDALYNDF